MIKNKQMLKNYIFTFLTIICISCNYKKPSVESADTSQGEFSKFDSLVKLHFPSKMTEVQEVFLMPSLSEEFEIPDGILHNGIFLRRIYSLSHSELETIQLDTKDAMFSAKHAHCCFICDSYENTSYRTKCLNGEFPVSTFFQERANLGIDDPFLASDFDIYIIDAKQGEFVPNELMILENCEDNWDHGFTRGIALSQPRMIALYWVQIW